jgi:hypothetical protein
MYQIVGSYFSTHWFQKFLTGQPGEEELVVLLLSIHSYTTVTRKILLLIGLGEPLIRLLPQGRL